MATETFSFTIELIGEESPFSYTLFVEDWVAPWIINLSPYNGETGIGGFADISFDILDDYSGVDISSLNIYLNDQLVFDNLTFISPWDGSTSAFEEVSIDGYNGYHILLNNSSYLNSSSLYTIRIVVSDNYGNSIDESSIFYTGMGISSISQGPYEISLELEFEGDLLSDDSLLNPANYVFNNNMYARNVEELNSTTVRLWVELFYGNRQFTLTTNNIKDSYGADILQPWNSITFGPFYSSANIGNYNGKVRTWRESNLVSADTQRIYLAGVKGIDIFRRESGVIPIRWAQVFDNYGINSIFVANFGGEYIFSDSNPPYVSEMNPAPLETIPATQPISFIIVDDVTSVDVESVSIYINEELAFSGSSGGWKNGFSGKIDFYYQYLKFSNILPLIPYTIGEVEVSISALDLLNNSLNFSYIFYVE